MPTTDDILYALGKLESVCNADPYWDDYLQPAITLLYRLLDDKAHAQEEA